MTFLFAVLLSMSAQAHAESRAFDLNDVSILVPLPPASEFTQLLKPADVGVGGELLPEAHVRAFGDLVSGLDQHKVYSDQLRVVGIRLDSCFIEGVGPQKCRRQIRLAWQPVFASKAGGTTTIDAAAHTFYDFNDNQEWNEIVRSWPRLAGGDLGQPVQPNPRLVREGLNGSYWKALREVLLSHVGTAKLSRVTVMTLPFDNLWIFMGADISAGVRQRIQIPRTKTDRQTFALSLDSKKFEGGVEPRLTGDSFWNMFLKDSDEIKVAGTIQEIADVVDTFQNPAKHNTGTLDCVSCHASEPARRWTALDWRYPKLSQFPARYVNAGANLTNLTVSPKTNRIRAFGYFGNEPQISQRLINETAEVVDRLNAIPEK